MSGRVPFARRTRWIVRGFAVLCLFWVFYFPLRPDRLFRAVPPGMALGSYHRDLAREWRLLAEHPRLIPLLERAGVADAGRWRDDEGIYLTLYWLTGRHTVFGLAGHPDDEIADLRVTGASYVGWKARPMELLWRIRWVPGLGRLDVTPSGTRYLTFRRSKTMRALGLVLSLDIVEGVLVGVLSSDPDAARELAARVRYDAPVESLYRPEAEPWRNLPKTGHRLWIPARTAAWLDRRIGPWEIDVDSFAAPSLRLDGLGSPWFDLPGPPARWGFGRSARPVGPAAAREAPFAAAMLSSELLQALWPGDWPTPASEPRSSLPWVTFDGKPHGGSLAGFAVPTLTARIPWNNGDSTNPAGAGESPMPLAVLAGAGETTKWSVRSVPPIAGRAGWVIKPGDRLLPFRIGSEESPFVETGAGWLTLGSNRSGYRSQQVALASEGRPFTRAPAAADGDPEVAAWVWIDCERADAEVRHLAAVAQLAARLSDGADARVAADRLAYLVRGLHAAAALGQVEGRLRVTSEGLRATLATLNCESD